MSEKEGGAGTGPEVEACRASRAQRGGKNVNKGRKPIINKESSAAITEDTTKEASVPPKTRGGEKAEDAIGDNAGDKQMTKTRGKREKAPTNTKEEDAQKNANVVKEEGEGQSKGKKSKMGEKKKDKGKKVDEKSMAGDKASETSPPLDQQPEGKRKGKGKRGGKPHNDDKGSAKMPVPVPAQEVVGESSSLCGNLKAAKDNEVVLPEPVVPKTKAKEEKEEKKEGEEVGTASRTIEKNKKNKKKRDKGEKRGAPTVDGGPSLLGGIRSLVPGFPLTRVVVPVKKASASAPAPASEDTMPPAPVSDPTPAPNADGGVGGATTEADDPLAGIPPLQRMAMEAEMKHRNEGPSGGLNRDRDRDRNRDRDRFGGSVSRYDRPERGYGHRGYRGGRDRGGYDERYGYDDGFGSNSYYDDRARHGQQSYQQQYHSLPFGESYGGGDVGDGEYGRSVLGGSSNGYTSQSQSQSQSHYAYDEVPLSLNSGMSGDSYQMEPHTAYTTTRVGDFLGVSQQTTSHTPLHGGERDASFSDFSTPSFTDQVQQRVLGSSATSGGFEQPGPLSQGLNPLSREWQPRF